MIILVIQMIMALLVALYGAVVYKKTKNTLSLAFVGLSVLSITGTILTLIDVNLYVKGVLYLRLAWIGLVMYSLGYISKEHEWTTRLL